LRRDTDWLVSYVVRHIRSSLSVKALLDSEQTASQNGL